MRLTRRTVGAFLVLTLLLPTGHAEPVSGALTIHGMELPMGAETTLAPEAAVIRQTERVGVLSLTASSLRVTIYEKQYVAPAVPIGATVEAGLSQRSFTVTGATVAKTQEGNHDGYLGVYPDPSATLRILGADATTGTPAALSTVKSEGDGTPDAPSLWWYSQRVQGPHVRYETIGAVTFNGPGSLKIYGLDVTVQGAENTSAETFQTGYFQDDAIHARRTWLVLEADDLNLSAEGSAPIEAAAKTSARLAWNGAATFSGASGSFRSDGAAYSATEATVTLEGGFSAILTPQNGKGATMQAEGDLRMTNLAAVRAPISPLQEGIGSWGLAAAGLAVAAGGALAAVVVARHKDPAHRAKHFIALARKADCEGEWDEALSHVRAARQLTPKDGYLAHWEAVLQKNRGQIDAALAAFDEASLLDRNGAAAFQAAVCAARAGHQDQALAFAARAIEQAPAFAAELADVEGWGGNDPFKALRSDPAFKRLLAPQGS